MKKYKLNITSDELSILKFVVYSRKVLLKRKVKECKGLSIEAGLKSALKNTSNLLKKLCKIQNSIFDFYNYELIEREDKSYNDYLKDNFKDYKPRSKFNLENK